MALLIECPTPDFSLGHDLTVVRSSPMLGSLLAAWNLSEILSFPLSAHPPLMCGLSQNKIKKKEIKAEINDRQTKNR